MAVTGVQELFYWSVSELTRYLKEKLDQDEALRLLLVKGEISGFRPSAAGHLYFDLKDDKAVLHCVLFANAARKLAFTPENGRQVRAVGRVTVYEARGQYQLIAEELEPEGLGALHLALEQLRQRLAAEGLFDPERKRPLPFLPKRVGLVTSLSGAAVRDMITTIRRRCDCIEIVVAPALVQGDGAPDSVASALGRIVKVPGVEVVIVGRGGGSMEELMAFNSETVVRALAACPVPVVSAVGHETDTTLADWAADLRAATPTGAAELVAPDKWELVRTIEEARGRAVEALRRKLILARSQWTTALDRPPMRHPLDWVHRLAQRADSAVQALGHGVQRRLNQAWQKLRGIQETLAGRDPRRRVVSRYTAGMARFRDAQASLTAALRSALGLKERRLAALTAGLRVLGPEGVLARGYSITTKAEDGRVVRSVAQAPKGTGVHVQVADGIFTATAE